jgi:hypothetical protein
MAWISILWGVDPKASYQAGDNIGKVQNRCRHSPHKIYVVSIALSSIFIISSTIPLKENIFSLEECL